MHPRGCSSLVYMKPTFCKRMPKNLVWVFLLLMVNFHGCFAKGLNNTSVSTRPSVVNIASILTFDSIIGKVAKIALQAAIEDVNSDPNILIGTKLKITLHDSNFSAFMSMMEALQVMETDTVALIGPQSSVLPHVISHVANELQVPLLSFTATDPTLNSLQYPFFVRTTHSDLYQMAAIADIIKYYEWRKVTAIYFDDDHGRNGIISLGDQLASRGCEISHKAPIKPLATKSDISDVLVQVALMESRILVVHTYPHYGLDILEVAKSLNMLDSGYVWIATNWLSTIIDISSPLSSKTIDVMQGLITLRTHTKDSELTRKFASEWRNLTTFGLSTYCLYAYDTVWLLARALDAFFNKGGNISFSKDPKLQKLPGEALNFDSLSIFNGGKLLLQDILNVKMEGLTGVIEFTSDKTLVFPAFEVINVIGTGVRRIGYWSNFSGLSTTRPEKVKINKSNSSELLHNVIWPGQTVQKPRGWIFANNGNQLKIGVPNRVSFQEFVGQSKDNYAFKGHCIDVFTSAVNLLPYAVPYKFQSYGDGVKNPSNTKLVTLINSGVFDAVVGDITITTNRTRIADFTQPFIESGLVVVVPVRRSSSSTWAFLKPFSPLMWFVSLLFFLIVGAVVWILEHRVNDEFRGPPKRQLVTVLWFSFSTLFSSHRENTLSTLGRIVLILWLFVVLIINSSYTASLTSILTVQKLSSPIKGIESLMASKDPIGYQENSFVRNYLVGELGIKSDRLVPLSLPEDYEKALKLGPGNGGVSAVVDERAYVELFLSSRCDFSIVGQEFTRNGWGFAFPRDSPLAADMSTAILKLSENGELQRIHDKWLIRSACSSQGTQFEVDQLELTSFQGLFMICGLACFLALVLYFVLTIRQFTKHYPTLAESTGRSVRSGSLQTFFSFVDEKEETVRARSKRKYSEESSSRTIGDDGSIDKYNSNRRDLSLNTSRSKPELRETFTRLGQGLSTRPDLWPPEFLEELSKVQASYSSVHFPLIPQLDFEIPPEAQRGSLSTVEGILLRASEELQALQEERKKVDPQTAEAIDKFISKLKECATGNFPFTFILDDPAGNSFVENPFAPSSDPSLRIELYDRSHEQQELLGYSFDPTQSTQELPNVEPHGSVGAVAGRRAIAQGSTAEFSESLFRYTAPEEVMTFPSTCGACAVSCETRMFLTKIPYFQEVIVMASTCDACGYRNSELKPGGAIPPKGKKIAVSVKNIVDLSRDVIKSDTASVIIPEIDLELTSGTLGGIVTTEAYEEAIVAKYGDDTSCYPLLDSQIWLEVSGGKKKGRVFGFGSISDPESFLTGTSSTATSREKKAAEMEAKAAEMEVKHHKMCEELDAKAAALEVKQKQIDEKYERFEKMFYELQNMREIYSSLGYGREMPRSLVWALLVLVVDFGGLFTQGLNNTNVSTRPEVVNIASILTFDSTIGKVAKIALEAAIQDVNSDPTILSGTELKLTLHDANYSGFLSIMEALQVMETENVALIGPQSSVIAHVISHVANELQVPLLSFTATDPTLNSLQYPFFVRTTHSDLYQMAAIADIVKHYEWKKVTAIYIDDDHGRNGIVSLGDELTSRGCQISYKAPIKPLATNTDISDVLVKVALMESRVIVVHTYSDIGLDILEVAKHLGMLDSGYVWIATNWLSTIIDISSPLSLKTIDLMQGFITLKTYTKTSNRTRKFASEWRNLTTFGLSTYCLYAYDTVWLLARALDTFFDKGGNISFSKDPELRGIRGEILNYDSLSVFNGGELLLRDILDVKMEGLTGVIEFTSDNNLVFPAFEVINVVGTGFRRIGYWSKLSGLSTIRPETNSTKSSSEGLDTVIWPGPAVQKPRGWVFPDNGKQMKVGVPHRVSFQEFVGEGRDNQEFYGYCIDVFTSAANLLPYALPYKFHSYGDGVRNPSNTKLVNLITTGVYDAVAGDIVITTDRTRLVDFTQPFIESGLVVVVPVRKSSSSTWAFLKPFSPLMWTVSGIFFLVVGVVVWILEHRVNDEFRGPPRKQIVTVLWFSFSTLFSSHRENTLSTLGRMVVLLWLFVVLIINSSYTASLTSILTVQKLSSSITGIESLIQSKEPIGYQENTFVKDYLVGELGIHESRLIPYSLPEEYEKALKDGPDNGGVAAVVDQRSYIELFLSTRCDFSIVGQEFTKTGWGFAFPRDSPLAADMSTAILELSENGELQRIHDKWLMRSACSSQGTKFEVDQLELTSFKGLFLICGLVCFLALIIYFARMIHKFTKYNPTDIPEPSERSLQSGRLQSFISFVNEKQEIPGEHSKRKHLEGSSSRTNVDEDSICDYKVSSRDLSLNTSK
ncbi:hypothetical protein LXL04_013908 [Taraxacum kok-saghyz]